MNSRFYQFLPEWAGDNDWNVQVCVALFLVLPFTLPQRGRRQPS